MYEYFCSGSVYTVAIGYSDNFVRFEVPQSMKFHTKFIGYSPISTVVHIRFGEEYSETSRNGASVKGKINLCKRGMEEVSANLLLRKPV